MSVAAAHLTADSYQISLASPSDAEAIVECSKSVRESSILLDMIYPKEKAHLTTAEEFHNWRVQGMRKLLGAKDLLYFKVMIPQHGDESEKMVGYAAWWMPGHFSFGKTLLQTLESRAEEGDVGGRGGEDDTKKMSEADGGVSSASQPRKEDVSQQVAPPACMDGELREEIASKIDKKRRELWGDDANFWYLGALGVDPAHQRRGIATRLVREGLDRADHDRLPAYVEASPNGALMFPKFGFRKVDEEPFFPGKYVMEFHVRPAQSTQQDDRVVEG